MSARSDASRRRRLKQRLKRVLESMSLHYGKGVRGPRRWTFWCWQALALSRPGTDWTFREALRARTVGDVRSLTVDLPNLEASDLRWIFSGPFRGLGSRSQHTPKRARERKRIRRFPVVSSVGLMIASVVALGRVVKMMHRTKSETSP